MHASDTVAEEAAPPSAAGHRSGALWLVLAALLAGALALPLLVVDVPPVLDYPNHLARFAILAHPHDPVLSQIYAPHWRLLPNLGIDLIGAGLLKLVPVHVGGRLLLGLSLFAPLLGVIAYHRAAFGRFELWPLVAGIIATSGIFQLGFMNFLLSLGLAFAAAGLWLALRRRHDARAVAAGALAVVAIFFAHLFGVLLFALLIGSFELAQLYALRGQALWRAAAAAMLRIALTLLPAVVLFALCPLSQGTASIGPWQGPQKLWALFTPYMTTNLTLTLLSGLTVFCTVVLLARQARWAPGGRLALAVLGIVMLAAPSTLKNGTFIDVRLGLMIGLVLIAVMAPRFSRRQGQVVCAVFAALIALRCCYFTVTWTEHRRDLADVRHAIEPIQPGAKVLMARGHPGNDTATPVATRALPGIYRFDGHLGALVAIERHAFWPLIFADPSQQPLDVLPPYKALSSPGEPVDLPYLAGDDDLAPDYIAHWRSKFDYVLLIDPPEVVPEIAGLTAIRTTPYARLYRVQPKG